MHFAFLFFFPIIKWSIPNSGTLKKMNKDKRPFIKEKQQQQKRERERERTHITMKPTPDKAISQELM